MNYSYEKVDKLLCVSADIGLIAGHVQSGFPESTWHDIGNLELSVRIHGSLESLAIYMYTLPPCQWNREKFAHSKHNIEMTFSLDVIDTYISYFLVWSSPRKWAVFFFTPFNNMKPWWRIISDVVKLDSGKQNCHEQAILVLLFHKCVTSSIPFSKYNSLIFPPANLLFPWACWYLWGCFLSISVVGEVDLSLKSISRYTVT